MSIEVVLHVYVVVNFLSQLIFSFPLLLWIVSLFYTHYITLHSPNQVLEEFADQSAPTNLPEGRAFSRT